MFVNNKLFSVTAIGAVAIMASGCASTYAPKGWLPPAEEAQSQAFGGWISVKYNDGTKETYVDGELIAVNDDSVFILADKGLVALSKSQILNATATGYDAKTGSLAAWSVFGTATTISNGLFLVFTAPIWIITGSAATASASHAPQEVYPRKQWNQFHKYARFPFGMPEGLNRQSLRPKSM